jgi:hypothetical protein
MRQRNRLRHRTLGPSGAVGQRLRRLAEWVIAGSFTAVGCGQQPVIETDDPHPTGAWERVACGDLLLVVSPITPARPIDYLGVFAGTPGRAGVIHLSSDFGDPCQSAMDQTACLTALARQLDSPRPCAEGALFCVPFAVSTAGDETESYDDASQLAKLLGEIDTPSEAVLIAQQRGLKLACPHDSILTSMRQDPGTFVQPTASGYRVRSRWQECASKGDQLIEVHSDGSSGDFELDRTGPWSCGTVGRRPAGLVQTRQVGVTSELGSHLAQAAQLEAASVPAFQRLARELLQLGAAGLVGAARRSACDEVRHARRMTRLAARYGSSVEAPRIRRPSRMRSAVEIARENAIEGCVRESFGALLAWQQAALARDPVVAEVMLEIAQDETRHAELAWRVASWLEPQLPARERAAVSGARSQALRQLDAEIAADPLPSDARAAIGWPSAANQHALLNRMASELALS